MARFNIRPYPFLPIGTWVSFPSPLQNGEKPTHCVKLPWCLQESTCKGLPYGGRTHRLHMSNFFSVLEPPTGLGY